MCAHIVITVKLLLLERKQHFLTFHMSNNFRKAILFRLATFVIFSFFTLFSFSLSPLPHPRTHLGAMAKGKGGKKEEKTTQRPTRCPPGFQWAPRGRLVEAADRNDLDRVKRLLSRGEDPTAALHHAIGRGRLLVALELLNAGADVMSEPKPGDYFVPPPVVVDVEVREVMDDRSGWLGLSVP